MLLDRNIFHGYNKYCNFNVAKREKHLRNARSQVFPSLSSNLSIVLYTSESQIFILRYYKPPTETVTDTIEHFVKLQTRSEALGAKHLQYIPCKQK